MNIFADDNKDFSVFTGQVETVISEMTGYARGEELAGLCRLLVHFKAKIEDFYRENRKLNIGIVGQVKAGKSSFLNTLLFDGREILPKASTPKTATLTKMEYAEENVIQIEYYSPEEWEVLEDNALVDLEDEIYSSAREIVNMVRRNGVEPYTYLERGSDRIEFADYETLISSLNDYVGEDGRFTPIVKAVTLQLNKEEFRGLSIVDTPGLNDPIASRTIRTKEFIELCDVVFFLSQSGSFLDKSDWILLSSQLPQKGVKKLVLVASKYDSGIRDILRVQDEDDIFGENDNTSDTIPEACRIIKKKLGKRAKGKVEEFVRDLEARGSAPQLIEVIRQCAAPVMASSLAYNMTGKSQAEFTPEEKNIYAALNPFSEDMEADLRLLGNFDEIKDIFGSVVSEKEAILGAKAESFVPNAVEELKNLLMGYLEKTRKRAKILESNDRERLLEQKERIERQMGEIKADIAVVFGELCAKLESEKQLGIRELRDSSKEYLGVRERTGSVTKIGSYTTGFLFWKKVHEYPYEEHYSYCIAADAIENLRKYGLDASNQLEEVFSNALQIREIKRRLLDIVVNHFDLGSEKYDSSLFRIMVEETIGSIVFPVLDIDISEAMDHIAGKFNGELISAGQKTELTKVLSGAISQIYEALCRKLEDNVTSFKEKLASVGQSVEAALLQNITREFKELLSQCENKDREIAGYKEYAAILERELGKL